MSNVDRPTTGLKPCAKCDSTDRDSNGQCRCRNTLYRLTKGLGENDAKRVVKAFDKAVSGGQDPAEARDAVRATLPTIFPAKKAAAKKAAAKKGHGGLVKPLAKKAAAKAAESKKDYLTTPPPVTKGRYGLVLADGSFTSDYARKDAAVKNGAKSGGNYVVWYNGKIVA